jgi:hypothetical protein
VSDREDAVVVAPAVQTTVTVVIGRVVEREPVCGGSLSSRVVNPSAYVVTTAASMTATLTIRTTPMTGGTARSSAREARVSMISPPFPVVPG